MDRITKILISFLFANAIAAAQDSADIRILQIKENRLYFDRGTESMIFPGADFLIGLTECLVFGGEIEYSLPGISISYSFDSPPMTELDGFEIIHINRAVRDSINPINIQFASGIFDRFRQTGLFSNPQVRIIEPSGDPAGNQGAIDGIIGFKPYESNEPGSRIDSLTAPFYFTMIPNLKKDINSGGTLTTALYYHHNVYKAGLIFDGQGLDSCNRHYAPYDSTNRIYEYGTVNGGKLFRSLKRPGQEITIFSKYPILENYARYFATFINRYGCNGELTEDSADAGLWIYPIPIIPDSATGSMRTILDILGSFGTDKKEFREKLKLLSQYLSFAETAETEEKAQRYLKLADDLLQTELGVFPLFRPTLYMTLRQNILGSIPITYDAIGFENLGKVILPNPGKDIL